MSKLRLTNGEISSLCMELFLLIHSGLGIGDGLHLLAEESSPEFRELLTAMAEKTDGGEPLSAAMKENGGLPEYVSGLTACGEQAGRTEEALHALSEYYDARERLGNRIRGALLYPAVLLLLMLVVIGALLAKVLPVFNDVFASLGGQMTGLAGGLLVLGGALDRTMPVLLVVLALLVALLAAVAASAGFRDRLLRHWNARHGDHGLSRSVSTARFAQALAMGLRSGLPVEDALDLAASLGGDCDAAKRRYADCHAKLAQGTGLAEALRAAQILPPAYCRMLALGVRSGTSDTVIQEIARRLEESCTTSIEETVGRVEPTLVIVTSLLVGVILLSVMLPLMNIMTAIG